MFRGWDTRAGKWNDRDIKKMRRSKRVREKGCKIIIDRSRDRTVQTDGIFV